MFKNYINKNNLHHVYLIEGGREVIPLLLEFLDLDLGFKTTSNKDFYFYTYDTFKIDDARALLPIKSEKSFGGGKKIILIYTNFFLVDAQNSLLKMFEDPIIDTHFFIISPNKEIFIPTLLSRICFIKNDFKENKNTKIAEDFLKMKKRERILFIKNFIAEVDDDNEEESLRSKSLEFINSIEAVLYKLMHTKDKKLDVDIFEKIIEIRKNLHHSGSSPKMLLEAVALILPD